MLGGCKRNIQNNDAVKQGVMTYLAKRSDLVSMDVKVTSVTYQKDEALAVVHFQAKGDTGGGPGLSMQYLLERKGDLWVVKRKSIEGHGTAAMPQEGSGSIGAMPQTMPPGHPTVDSGGLPAGHPPVGSDKKPGKSQ
jgi:hypothetical protein